jgi:glycosyltransferase involved in cell wall biosynthesis
MRSVLHVIDHLGLGGAQSALLDLVAARDADRFEVAVAVLHGRGPFAESIEGLGVRVHSLASSRWDPAIGPRFVRLVRAGRFDVIHFHLQGANWIAKPLAALACDAVRIAHDHASGDLRFRGVLSLVPDALAHLFSHRVIAVSDGVKEFLVRWESLPRDMVEVVPNGIDTSAFAPSTPEKRRRARAALGVGSGDWVVGALGRLATEKNFDLLADLAASMPGCQFLLGGEGPVRGRLEAAAAGGRCGGRLRLLGRVEDRPGFYAALDALVICSFHEGLPMVLLEAMAAGVPVVASRLPDLEAALDGGACGLMADPACPETFVSALESLRSSPPRAAALASAARARCTEHYAAGACARRIGDIHEHTLAFYERGIASEPAHGQDGPLS